MEVSNTTVRSVLFDMACKWRRKREVTVDRGEEEEGTTTIIVVVVTFTIPNYCN